MATSLIYKRNETIQQSKSGIEILTGICCQHLLGLETCSSSWVGHSWTCSCLSLVGFFLLCMGSCCGLCLRRHLHVLPCHHCSSRPLPGFHKAESHQVPCMRQSRLSYPPSQ